MSAMSPRQSVLVLLVALTTSFAAAPRAVVDVPDDVVAFLQRNCVECHGAIEPAGELALIGFVDGTRDATDVAAWRRVRGELRAGRMPPKKRARPEKAETEAVLRWIDAQLALHTPPIEPGRVTLRRLNAREYTNTVRDLVGVHFDAASVFPTDDVGHGFDCLGDVLSMPDVLLEKYASAAERIAREAVFITDPNRPPERRLANDKLAGSEGIDLRGGSWALYRSGDVSGEVEFERAGEYVLRARAFAQQAGPDPARMELRLSKKPVERFDVTVTEESAQTYECRVQVDAGKQRFAAAFVNDFYEAKTAERAAQDRNLYVEWLEIAGPVGAFTPSEFQTRWLDASFDAPEMLRRLASQAWRRPASDEDVTRLLALSPSDAPRETVLRNALEALLVSPRFLFLVENDPVDAPSGSVRALDAWELAARLSYFLWSSAPDAELFERARAGLLGDENELESQTRRMLRDPRASALTRGFAAQWLQLSSLERASPDPQRFGEFDDELRAAMRAETEMLFDAVLREERAARELLDPDFTFVNERLARHYGFDGVAGSMMQRVRLDGARRATRGGLLAQASVLTVTSNPTRTSPVKRGKWILDNVLGQPPPPPLPGVDSLDESRAAARAASLRERLARHREDPACSVCHERMDGLGFALEGFDPIGRERATDEGFAIDASGELDGERFAGVGELKRLLASNPQFVRALAQKLATYGLGRGLREADEPALDALVDALPTDPTLTDIVLGVVRLHAFRNRVVVH